MRLFIAIQLNEDLKEALTSAQATLQSNQVKGYYSVRQNLHLTLAFIGEYSTPDYVLDAMEQVDFEPFPLTLAGHIRHFGNLLWAGVDQSNHLERLARRLRRSLAEHQIPFDKKSFSPHITMLRNAEYSTNSDFHISDVQIDKASMTVSDIVLLRSDFGKHGAIYSEVGRVTVS